MSSGITLSAGVRQNLLSLQATADMMATTQNRLATGKKVNSALDNPSNFFTSQSLSDRAGDLNSLLDSIGQATKTLDAANNGITSLTQLVQSAKSIAQQARSATAPTATYSAVDISGALPTETLATTTGTADLTPKAVNLSFTNLAETLGNTTGATFANDAAVATATTGLTGTDKVRISVVDSGGTAKNFDATIDNSVTTIAGLVSAFSGASDGGGHTLSDYVTVAGSAGNPLTFTAKNADIDFTVGNAADGTTTAAALTATGLDTKTGAHNSTSLLDQVVANGGTAGSSTLTLSITGSVDKTVTFGTGGGEVSTIADLNSWLNTNGNTGAASGTISGTTFSLSLAAGVGNSVGLTATDVGVTAALGLDAATADYNAGARGGMGTALSKTFHSDLTLGEIDTDLANGTSLAISVDNNDGLGSQTQTVGLSGDDNLDDVVTKLKANATLNAALDISNSSGSLKLTAKNADVDFTVAGGLTATALGLATTAKTSNSLFDQIVAAGGADGDTFTVAANGGTAQTITFGKGEGKVSTLAEFTTALSNLSGVTASVIGSAFTIGVASGSTATSLEIGGNRAATLTTLGTSAQTKTGTKTDGDANATRSSLQNDFNDVLDQIDALSKDASYNGINLLNADDLKVSFNENGTSSLTIKGVTYNATNLGLDKQNGTAFQDNDKIDATITAINNALTSLRTQASKFGSNLTTVQTRQDFTKNMVNTLQTGGDALVLADTNEEGANMLALQTRQQLSTTALSLANQANQAVLRLF
jgi:flagellin